jgi:hypothetical protein
VAGLRVDAAHRAHHLRAEQDVLRVDHLGEEVDPRLVVDAGIEVDIVHDMAGKRRLLEHVGQAPVASPVIGHRAAAVRDDEAQRREVLEEVALDELHEGDGVGRDIEGAGRVEPRIAAPRNMDHRRHIQLNHLLVEGIPETVGERRMGEVAAAWIGVEVAADKAELADAALELLDGALEIRPGRLR